MHTFSNNCFADEFFEELAATSQMDIFMEKPIQNLILYKYPIVR